MKYISFNLRINSMFNVYKDGQGGNSTIKIKWRKNIYKIEGVSLTFSTGTFYSVKKRYRGPSHEKSMKSKVLV